MSPTASQYLAQRDELAPIWKSVMGAHFPAVALVEVERIGEQLGAGRDRGDRGGAGLMYDSFVRDRLPPRGTAARIPAARVPGAAQRRRGIAQGRRPRCRWRSSMSTAAGPMPISTDFSGRIARLLVEEEGLVPGNRVLLRGPNGYTMLCGVARHLEGGRRGRRYHASAAPRRDRDGDRARGRSAMRSSTAVSSAISARRPNRPTRSSM